MILLNILEKYSNLYKNIQLFFRIYTPLDYYQIHTTQASFYFESLTRTRKSLTIKHS